MRFDSRFVCELERNTSKDNRSFATLSLSSSELRRFMGMINQLDKFSPNVAKLSAPLRRLLSNKQVWQWGPDQDNSYKSLQAELTKPTVLKLYNTQAPTKIRSLF